MENTSRSEAVRALGNRRAPSKPATSEPSQINNASSRVFTVTLMLFVRYKLNEY